MATDTNKSSLVLTKSPGLDLLAKVTGAEGMPGQPLDWRAEAIWSASKAARAAAKQEPPVQTTSLIPEYGRVGDVERVFGLKRRAIYYLLEQGKIRGCIIPVKGKLSGIRLLDLASIRRFIQTCMNAQNPAASVSTSLNPSPTPVMAGNKNGTRSLTQ